MSSWIRSHLSVDRFRPSVDDLVALLRRYLFQETIGPLKAIAKGVAIALGGALLFAIGGVIVLVGALRVFQDETGSVFSHTWAFAPYLFTAVVGLAMIGLAALATFRSLSPARQKKA
jgi:hypothetical protein